MRTSATVCLLGGIALWSWGCAGAPEPGAGRDERLAITGVVLNEAGRAPEAGVWVIAETRSLPGAPPHRRKPRLGLGLSATPSLVFGYSLIDPTRCMR